MNDSLFHLLIFIGIGLGGATVSGLIGLGLGMQRGRAGFGFMLGFLLGPIGWLLVFVLPKNSAD